MWSCLHVNIVIFLNFSFSDPQQFPIYPCHLSNSSICENPEFAIKQTEISSVEKNHVIEHVFNVSLQRNI